MLTSNFRPEFFRAGAVLLLIAAVIAPAAAAPPQRAQARPMPVRRSPPAVQPQLNNMAMTNLSSTLTPLALARLENLRLRRQLASQRYQNQMSSYYSSYYPYYSQSSSYGNDSDRSYSTANYGSQTQSYGSSLATYTNETSKPSESDVLLTSLGLPVKDGHLDWPVALAALPPGEETRNLRQQVESRLIVMAKSSGNGKANAEFDDQARRSLDRLEEMTHSNRYSMTAGTHRAAVRFLAQMDDVLKVLQKDGGLENLKTSTDDKKSKMKY
jgi:hypothetical protein